VTTIAYKDGVMACDSCWTGDEMQEASQTKIVRLASGALLGGSGDNDSREIFQLLDKIKRDKQLPTRTQLAALRVSFSGLLALPNGEIFKISADFGEKESDSDYGIWPVGRRGLAAAGSGCHLAIGAMAAGKSAREAVAIACKFDINSRLPVHSLELAIPRRK
jgi:hypothetical protein